MEGGDFPHASVVKNPPANAGDLGLIPESGRSPGKGNGHPLQYSCLRNPMDRKAWWTTVRGVTKESNMTVTKQQATKIGRMFGSGLCQIFSARIRDINFILSIRLLKGNDKMKLTV